MRGKEGTKMAGRRAKRLAEGDHRSGFGSPKLTKRKTRAPSRRWSTNMALARVSRRVRLRPG